MLVRAQKGGSKSSSEGVRSLFTQASLMMSEHYNDSALKTWKALYRMDSTNANFAFFLGQMYLQTSAHKAEALRYLERAASHIAAKYIPDDAYEKSAPPLAYYYFGRALHLNYQFADAVVNLNLFKKLLSKNDSRQKDIDYWVNCCNNGMALMQDKVLCKITNVGDSINSIYPDYDPTITADEQEMIFTTRRPGGMNETGAAKDSNGFYNEDIYISYAKPDGSWTLAKSISNTVNTPGNDASVSLSPDGQQLIIFRDNTQGGGTLFASTLRGTQWNYPQPIDSANPGVVNSGAYNPSACLSPDQKTLYFASKRAGGLGGTDLYKINLMDSGGKWGAPVNLGPTINTEYDEDAPFIHTDNSTMFFSSKGHNTMGGFDIFSAQIDSNGQFSNVKNMGYPINTPDDDTHFSLSPDGKRAYYSSIQPGSLGEKDIYQVLFAVPFPVQRVAVLVGYIKTPDGSQLPNDIVVKTGPVKNPGTSKTRVNPTTGKFLQVLHANRTYNVVISTQGKDVFNQNFYLPSDSSYINLSRAFFRTTITLGDTSNVFVPKPKVPVATMAGQLLLNDVPAQPVANMSIQLVDAKGNVLQTTMTNADGHFSFEKLPEDKSYGLSITTTDPKLKHLKKLYLANSKSKIVRTFDEQKEDAYLYHDLPANLDILSEMTRITAIPPKPIRIVSPDADYIEYFKYNADQNSQKESSMNALVTKIATKLLKDTVLLSIESSASKVPTGSEFANSNKVLADKRAQATKKAIIAALKLRKAKYTKLKFEITSNVQGPDYAEDAQDQDKYQNFQYVKVFIK